jgi:microcystin-dependent protein
MSYKNPTGTVLPFAGEIQETSLRDFGWLLCNGQQLDRAQYPDLFRVLGTRFGGDGIPYFNLPDLRGQFVRGTDRGTHRDPDAATRGTTSSGGAIGDRVGSSQSWATALPAAAAVTAVSGGHAHTGEHLPSDYYLAAHAITGNHAATWVGGTTVVETAGSHTHEVAGAGDKETRPDNICLHWIIKFAASAASGDSQSIAAGTVSWYAGDAEALRVELAAEGWLPCFGDVFTGDQYPDLHATIGDRYGSGGNAQTPDLRGQFIRGATNSVGQQESHAAALPKAPFTLTTSGVHSHKASYLPHDSYIENACAGHDVANFPSVSIGDPNADGLHSHVIVGGDAETRPVNIYLDHIIKATNS